MKSDEVGRYWEGNAETWTRQSRAGFDVYRDLLNTPAFLDILPKVTGLTGLDLGCGEGSNTRLLAARGAKMTAIDIAPTFIAHALEIEKKDPSGIDFQVADGSALPFADCAFDFATAFMSLMDMADQAAALREVERVLRPGGFFQFSILHPCFITPNHRTLRDDDGRVTGKEVRDYFVPTDGAVETWWFSALPENERHKVPPFKVPRFHRTLGEWVDMICSADLRIEKFAEPVANEELARSEPAISDNRAYPSFLHIRVRKSG